MPRTHLIFGDIEGTDAASEMMCDRGKLVALGFNLLPVEGHRRQIAVAATLRTG
jgi:hypothetical protein